MPERMILHLNLHREFFAQIAAGTKRTEYRSRTPYWRRRLESRHYDAIQSRNGYTTQAPEYEKPDEGSNFRQPERFPFRSGVR